MSPLTSPFTFSTPESATTMGTTSGRWVPADASTRQVVVGASLVASSHARSFREKSVNHRVQEEAGAVQKLDDGHVDVPELVRSGGADAVFRLRGMETTTWPEPAALADATRPRTGCGEYPARALRVEGESSDREVAKVEASYHLAHGTHFGGRELCWSRFRTAASVFQVARSLPAPGVEAGRLQADDAQRDVLRKHERCALDGGQQGSLALSVRDAGRVQAQPRHAHEDEQQTNDGQ